MRYEIDFGIFQDLLLELCEATSACEKCVLEEFDCCYYELINNNLPSMVTKVR